MTFAIEKGVPLAPARSNSAKYPFGEMAVGDSFLVPPTGDKNFCSQRRAASMWGARHNVTFQCRKVQGGLRIWRTA